MFAERAMAPPAQRQAATIAVAPIDQIGLAGEEAFAATGFLEDVIAELTRFPHLEVLAARTSLSLQPEDLAPDRILQSFGVTHLLDSSVRASPEAVQVRASLIETETGRQVWQQNYDVPLHRAPALPDDLAAHVANHLSTRINLTRLTRARTRPLTSLAAYDCWLRGRDCLRRGTNEAEAEAREFFERALSIDPAYARAYAGLSLSHFNDWTCQRWTQWEEGERLAFDYACKAEALDESDHVVQAVLGRIQIYRRNFGQGRRHLERMLALSPNDADTLMQTAIYFGFLGDAERSLAMVEKAFRLNPLHDAWYYVYAAIPYFLAGDLERFLELAERSPPHQMVDQSAFMAAACAHLGRMDAARGHAAQFLEVFRQKITYGRAPGPDEPVSFLLHVNPFTRQEDADRLVTGLRLAGLDGRWDGKAYLHDPKAEAARFVLAGDLWEASFAGRTAHIKDMKGCRDLALLLAAPRERIHCMEIAGRIAEGDAGAAMDTRARGECQARIRDLQADLEEAERHNDRARSGRIAAELDSLIETLSAALGLGGRGRRLGDPAEKARTAVTWRLRNAMKRIAAAHPDLGRHLESAVRTGAFCVYAPEKAIRWST